MQILWSSFASEMLSEIFLYYRTKANPDIARKIKSGIFSATKQLLKHPASGQVEPNLKSLNEGHRYLVTGHHKIIYKMVSEGILITDIFDTRQDPLKTGRGSKRS